MKREFSAGSVQPHWTAGIGPGEYAIREFDPKTSVIQGDRVLVFESQADAASHAQDAIEAHPKTGCLIYDSKGALVSRHVNAKRAEELARPPSPLKLAIMGVLLLLAGAGLFWFDWNRRFTVMIGILVGIRLLITGTIYVVRAIRGSLRS